MVAFFLCFFSSLSLTSVLHAEIIQLKNGNAIETKILKESDEFVTVESAGGKVKIPKKDIQMIWRGSKEELLQVRGKEVYFAKGVELYKEGRFADAAENFEQARIPSATSAILYANLGSAYASAGEARKAEENFLKSLEKTPNNPEVLKDLGRLYETQKDFKKAILYYEKAAGSRPGDAGLDRSRAYCYYKEGRFSAAAKVYGQLGEKNDRASTFNEALCFLRMGELDRAESCLNELLGERLPMTKAWLLRAEIYRKKKLFNEAESDYLNYLKLQGWDEAGSLGLGFLYLEMKDPAKAGEIFSKILGKTPENVIAMGGLAQALAGQGDFPKAVLQYQKISKKRPDDLAALNGLGLLYLKMNEPKKALEVYRRLFEIDDHYAKGHANAGLAYAFLEDADKALEEWTRALELDPKLEAAAQNKKLLEEVLRGDRNEKNAPK
jgi:tetratricopeptide (TPR) repeat protein